MRHPKAVPRIYWAKAMTKIISMILVKLYISKTKKRAVETMAKRQIKKLRYRTPQTKDFQVQVVPAFHHPHREELVEESFTIETAI